MFGIRWQTMGACFSIAILGASVAFPVPTLSAKDKESSSASAAGKTAKKKKADKRSSSGSTNSSNASPSADDGNTGGVATGSSAGAGSVSLGGGVASGSGSGAASSSGSGSLTSATSSGSSSVPPGVGGTAPAVKTTTPKTTRKQSAGSSSAKSTSRSARLDLNHPLVKKVVDVQNRNQPSLLSQKGVAGVATGLDEDGNVVIRVYITGADSPTIPTQIEGVAVTQVLTGPIRFAQRPPVPPAPIGASAFADTNGQVAIPCQGSVGTIGCRMKDSSQPPNIYALSCNHVFAGSQLFVLSFPVGVAITPTTGGIDTVPGPPFALGSNALQPSGSDVNCPPKNVETKFANILGTLAAVAPFYANYPDPCIPGNKIYTNTRPNVDANGNPTNLVDCALVKSSATVLDTGTPPDGYGVPRDTYVQASLGLTVLKYGAATRQTKGTVVGLNATYNLLVDISFYNIGIEASCLSSVTNSTTTLTPVAGFAGTVTVPFSSQIEVAPTAGFANFALSGDSGALVVTSDPAFPGNNPTALFQAVAPNGHGFCGDFNEVKRELVRALAVATGAQTALHVDSGPSSLATSQDGKIGRAIPNSP